jgi:hypothetical protein
MDSTDAPQIIEHIHKSVTYTPNECRWIPCSARFVSLGNQITITIILLLIIILIYIKVSILMLKEL